MYLNKNRGGDGGIPGYIMIYLVPSTSTINSMKSLIAHEVNHNMRYQYIDWDGGSLIELIIAEGLAENYVESLYGKAHIGPWVTNTNWSRDNVKIKNTIYNHLHLKHIFESMPFLYGDDINKLQGRSIVGLSHAAGYACGYHLVKYFLQKTNIPIEVATTLPAQKIINEVTEFWHTHTL
ncbi:Zn-dependent protease-protein [Staphylococcus aureus]|nr:Zn-dependent protease-protein [Staphylococcus aureus]CAC6718837.1 Zn-dependent protease-protein [Staphylococcus aureus]